MLKLDDTFPCVADLCLVSVDACTERYREANAIVNAASPCAGCDVGAQVRYAYARSHRAPAVLAELWFLKAEEDAEKDEEETA